MTLSRDQILSNNDRKRETVAVPEWGGDVIVSEMSGAARDHFEASLRDADGKIDTKNIRARVVALTLVDEAGELVFTDTDIEALGRKSFAALDRVASVARRLNGLGDKEVEEIRKN